MLSSYAACMHVQLGLGMGAVNCTEWVGGGGFNREVEMQYLLLCSPSLFFLEVGCRKGECITASG